ncbi:hypothetical protein DBN47_15000 [Clostridium botulinum]|nr:hypothetical protein DBN47_15000 [Clostridium botulinum]KOR54869.1 hypothetical protein ADT23_00300 [Clostridium botulinum]
MKKNLINISMINFILTPILYLCILMPISIYFKLLNLIPIAMLIHTILFCGSMISLEKNK